MELTITSRIDTVKNLNLFELVPGQLKLGNPNAQKTTFPVLQTIQDIQAASKTDTTQKPQRIIVFPTTRNAVMQSEKKLLVGGERFMESKKETRVISSVVVNDKEIGLPYREKANNSTDWLTVVLMLALVLFATVRNSFSNYLKYLMHSVINYSTANRMFQEKNSSVFQASIRLEVFFYLAASVFLYQVAVHFGVSFLSSKFLLYLICLGLVLSYYLLKNIIYRFIGSVTEGMQETSEYLFNLSNFNRITGIFIFPIVTLIAFNPFERVDSVIFAGVFILLGFYILLIRRGIGILLRKQFSIFYLFLYLCTLEFLPLLLIYKIVVV